MGYNRYNVITDIKPLLQGCDEMNGGLRIICLIAVLLVSLAIFPVYSYAHEGAETLELSGIESEKEDRIKEKLIISETEITDKHIVNFDVNSKGEVLVCLRGNFVNVYNDALELMYSVNYNIDGASAAFWYNDTAALYLHRSGMIVLIDESGIIGCYHVEDTDDSYRLINGKEKQRSYSTDEYTYELTFANDFQKIACTAPSVLRRVHNGNEEIVYCNEKCTSDIIFGLVGTALFVACMTACVIFSVKKNPHRKD